MEAKPKIRDRFRSLPLNPLRVFAVASRHTTFTAAAKHMGVSQVAISRQIAILEDYLGVKLFDRGERSAKLTEVGRQFGQEVSLIFDRLDECAGRLLSSEREKNISLRLYPTFANHWLLPRLSQFYHAYPEYRLRLDTTVEPLDFRGTYLDVAIQLGTGQWRDARCRKLFDEEVDVFCSPGYAERLGDLSTMRDFADIELLHAKYRRGEWAAWAQMNGYTIESAERTEFASSLICYSAARQGLGLAVGQTHLLEAEVASGHLVRPFNKPIRTGAAFYVIWPTMTSVATKTRRFVDWLLEVCGQDAEFFPSKARRDDSA